jgi:hypothetical protein
MAAGLARCGDKARMKVLNLRCANGHAFEGWYASDDEFADQNGRAQIECPLCADHAISRMPTAPRLNLSGAREPAMATIDLQAQWLAAARHVVENTEDVGEQFAAEARRIHHGEAEDRGIRGQASAEERAELLDEGIAVMALALPAALKHRLQ